MKEWSDDIRQVVDTQRFKQSTWKEKWELKTFEARDIYIFTTKDILL